MTAMSLRRYLGWIFSPRPVALSVLAVALGCGPRSGQGLPGYRNDLSKMQTTQITVKNQPFNVWLALTDNERTLGLMQVTEGELKPAEGVQRGMLFVFPDEDYLSFWMYNTITPLDIAYIDADGYIVKTHTMAPLETRTYPSIEPAQFALEVLAGTFTELGINEGDQVEIPDSVLKDAR
jgi:uncharacterized protein